MLREASFLISMFRGLVLCWIIMVTKKPTSWWHRDLLAFSATEDASSGVTNTIKFRNESGKLWDSTDEKVWSKRNNGERCYSSSLIEHECVAKTLDPQRRKIEGETFSASFRDFWVFLNHVVPNIIVSMQSNGQLLHLNYGAEFSHLH